VLLRDHVWLRPAMFVSQRVMRWRGCRGAAYHRLAAALHNTTVHTGCLADAPACVMQRHLSAAPARAGAHVKARGTMPHDRPGRLGERGRARAGSLLLQNGTHALWEWHRNQDAERVTADAVWIVRSEACTQLPAARGARARAPAARAAPGWGRGRHAGPALTQQ